MGSGLNNDGAAGGRHSEAIKCGGWRSAEAGGDDGAEIRLAIEGNTVGGGRVKQAGLSRDLVAVRSGVEGDGLGLAARVGALAGQRQIGRDAAGGRFDMIAVKRVGVTGEGEGG